MNDMDMTQQGYVRSEVSPTGVANVTFFHPNHNSLPAKLLQALVDSFEQLGADPAVRVIVLRSAEHKTFCAGASFDELSAIHDIESAQSFFNGFGRVINAMRRCPKIVVVRVHGKSVGGGVGLTAAADYAMASHFATFRLSELAVGFGPFVIGPAVERKIGVEAFAKLSLTPGEWQTAEWGQQKGLYQEVFSTVEQLDDYVAHFCDNLCQYSPAALLELKRIFWQGTEHWETLLPERAAISGRLSLTEHSKAAIAAFKAK
jgi:methylglutaconyl-CoA hydratase